MGLFKMFKHKEEKNNKLQFSPQVVKTDNVSQTLAEISKTYNISVSNLDFDILTVETFVKLDQESDFVSIDEQTIDLIKSVEKEIDCGGVVGTPVRIFGQTVIVGGGGKEKKKVEELEKGVSFLKARCPKIIVEVSGGITLEKLERIKHLPVDFVSSGSIITKATWKDISLEVK